MSEIRPPHILIVDDDEGMRFFMREAIASDNYELHFAISPNQAIEAAGKTVFDIALIDFKMPQMNGVELMQRLKAISPDLIVIIITAFGSRELVREAMNKGAYDFFTKPIDVHDLRFIVKRAIDKYVLQNENISLKNVLEGKKPFPELTGTSSAMQGLYERLAKVVAADVDVIITGESGTGKEKVADVIHNHSARSGGPFVKVNCAAIPDTLIEAELFGHEKGAFTGADRLKVGRFERANHGTIFLDEITEMNIYTQGKLLRVVQEREIERLGGGAPIKLDFRLIAASNRDLHNAVQEERLREDLFYRLNVVPIHIPPLRERRDDVIPLTNHFVREYAVRFGKNIRGLSADAEKLLQTCDFPGNVRQLENMIQRAIVLADGPELVASNFNPGDRGDVLASVAARTKQLAFEKEETIKGAVGLVEKDIIEQALAAAGGRKQEAAKYLKISRKGLYNKMKKYGLLKN